MTAELIQGDTLNALKALPDESVDAVVTDPPYGLSKEPNMVEVLTHWLAGDDYVHRGGGFMGKAWDSFVPGPSVWREVLRVLKPGGHALVFAGSRTQGLMDVSLRLAGFEIRDQMQWLYGSGFPKSMDVSKAIDKAAGAEREVRPVDPARAGRLVNQSGDYQTEAGWSAGGRKVTIDPPATPEAQQWEGWGTALKPAHEPIVVARKPLCGTVAANVLEHGTGALNIDGCRVGTDGGTTRSHQAEFAGEGQPGQVHATRGYRTGHAVEQLDKGRWPANVVLDEEAAAMLDEQTGVSVSGAPRQDRGTGGIWSSSSGIPAGPQYGDSGGASRFFYTAKASKSERNRGMPEGEKNDHPTVKPIKLMAYLVRLVTPPGGVVLDPYIGSGTTGIAARDEGFALIGIDRDAHYLDIAACRIGGEVARRKIASPKKVKA